MAKKVNRIDHVVSKVEHADVHAVTANLSGALQTAFYTFDRPEAGIRVVISHDSGVELIAMLGDEEAAAFPPMWLSVIYGVRDIEATRKRLADAGMEAIGAFDGVSGVESYCDRYTRFDEIIYETEVFAGLQMGFVQAEEQPDSRTAGAADKHINAIDHVIATIPLADLDAAIDKLSFVLQTAFYGPYDRSEDGVRVAASWDAGIVLVAPLDPAVPVVPGWHTVAYGVRDLDAALARLKSAGHEPVATSDFLSGSEPWVERFMKFRTARFEGAAFSGLPVILTDIEQHADQQNRSPA